LQAKGLLAPQGTPTDAIAPEAQAMAGEARSGVATGAKSAIAATVQGATQQGPANADAQAAAQMGVRPAMPPTNGAGGL
jgi:hypothetical protein